MRTVYIAAPFSRHTEAADAAYYLRTKDVVVRASWIDDARKRAGKDTSDPITSRKAWSKNDVDLATAEGVLALVWKGEGQEMFCEIARCKSYHRVHWVPMGDTKLPLTAYAFGDIHPSLQHALESIISESRSSKVV